MKSAVVTIDVDGPRVELSADTTIATDVCDLTTCEFRDDFRVETSVYAVGWPVGFDVISADPGGPSPFDFVTDGGSLVYVQGPLRRSRVPKLQGMVAPGQRLIEHGVHASGEWIELSYEHGGQAHWQRHATVQWARETVLVITAQALAGQVELTRKAASLALATLRPM